MKFPRVVSIQKSPNFYVTKVCLIQSQLSKLEIQNAAKDYLKGISSCSDFPWHLIEAWKGHDWYVRSCSKLFFLLSGVFLGLSWICVIPGSGRDWPDGLWASASWSDLWKNCTGSFFFCWDRLGNGLILASCCVPNQGGTFDCVSLFSWDGPARTEKGRCFVVTLVSEWGDGMYHVTCWVTLACGLLCTFVVSLETEACPAGTSVGSLRDSSKSWGIVLALGLRARAGGEQDGSVRLMLMERCSCAGSTLKWK